MPIICKIFNSTLRPLFTTFEIFDMNEGLLLYICSCFLMTQEGRIFTCVWLVMNDGVKHFGLSGDDKNLRKRWYVASQARDWLTCAGFFCDIVPILGRWFFATFLQSWEGGWRAKSKHLSSSSPPCCCCSVEGKKWRYSHFAHFVRCPVLQCGYFAELHCERGAQTYSKVQYHAVEI